MLIQLRRRARRVLRGQLGVGAYGDAVAVGVDIEHVEGCGGADAQALALADSEVEDAVVMADDLAIGGDKLAGGVREGLALLLEIGGEELLVVAAGDEADLLGVGLLGEGQTMPACHFADFRLGEAAEREEGAGELGLGEAEEEVGLVLGEIGGALEDPALAGGVVLVDGVVAGGDAIGADGAGGLDECVELEVVVAERAGDGRAAVEILRDEGADDVLLEAGLLVDDVVGDAEVLGDAAGVVDVIQRAAAAGLGCIGNAVLAGQAGLVPELEGEADDRALRIGGAVVLVGEHGRNRRGVDSSGHGYGDGFIHEQVSKSTGQRVSLRCRRLRGKGRAGVQRLRGLRAGRGRCRLRLRF